MIDALKTEVAPQDPHGGRRWHVVAKLAITILVAGVAVKWSWSTVAGDLFSAPDLRFADAFSVVLALALTALAVGMALRLGIYRFDR